MRKTLRCMALCAAMASGSALAQQAAQPLPALGANLAQTSVSGISSGGFMAAQVATAYSGRIMGVGVIAGGPYYCAGSYPETSLLQTAVTSCMSPLSPAVAADGKSSFRNATAFAQQGLIDPVAQLARQRVYLFSGAKDNTVKSVVVDAVQQFYVLAGASAGQLRYHKSPDAGHGFLTANPDNAPCGATSAPYINNCGFNQSHELLRHIYPDKREPASQGALSGELVQFDQREFIQGTRSSMDDTGYAYIPQACRAGSCAVHIAFHGCRQGASVVGPAFYGRTGYNEFADRNALVILYPQVHPSSGVPANPLGCWDFWGYSGEDPRQPGFHTRAAPQMAAVMAMVARLGQPAARKP
jgi:poly(3-hydroxybutyrate) depolymerase